MPTRRFNGHEKRVVAARQRWMCEYCSDILEATFEVDHVVPLHLGGEDNYETNAVAVCRPCHAKKTQREEIERLRTLEFARRRGSTPSLMCEGCGQLVSPYFLHACGTKGGRRTG